MTGGSRNDRECGMPGSAGTAESAVMTMRTEVAPEKCRSSLGTPISVLAHKRIMTKIVTRIRIGIMPRDILP